MGQFLSKRHQEQNHPYHHRQQYNYHHHPPPPPTHPPPPPTQPPPLPVPQTYASTSTVAPQHQPPPPPGPPPPYTPQVYNNYNYNYSRMPPPPQVTHQSYQYPYYVGQSNGWFQPPGVMLHPPPPMPLLAPVPYVDHQSAKKIKNDVNVHKDTIKLEVDEDNKDFHLVSFTFDALVDGSITIYYFAKEGANCSFTPLYPEIHVPVKVPFQQGSGQKFRQPSGSGIDLGFFDINDLSKPSVGDIFPLVISAETYASASTSSSKEEEPVEGPSTSPHAQITQAVIEKDNESHFRVKVMKQILWIDQVRYELREIFGMSDSSDETTINDNKDLGQECVICLTEPRDTAVLPCRHMCMCRGCANELRLQSNTCPICRQPIQELLEIKVVEEGKQNTQ